MKKLFVSAVCIAAACSAANAEPYVGLNLIYDNLQLDKSFGAAVTDNIVLSSIFSPELQELGLGEYESKDLYPQHYFGVSLDAGYNFSEHFGLEAYFQYNLKNSADEYASGYEIWDAKSNMISGGLDVMGYLPLTNAWYLIGTVGAGYYHFETETNIGLLDILDTGMTSHIKNHENHLGIRMGLGVQYDVNEDISVRALGRYITWKSDDSYNLNKYMYDFYDDVTPVDGIWEISAGVQYKF